MQSAVSIRICSSHWYLVSKRRDIFSWFSYHSFLSVVAVYHPISLTMCILVELKLHLFYCLTDAVSVVSAITFAASKLHLIFDFWVVVVVVGTAAAAVIIIITRVLAYPLAIHTIRILLDLDPDLDSGTLDADHYLGRHQHLIHWSLGHAPHLQKFHGNPFMTSWDML